MPLTTPTKVGNASCVVKVKYPTVLFVHSNTFNNQSSILRLKHSKPCKHLFYKLSVHILRTKCCFYWIIILMAYFT
jgi:hypothetical protein